MAGTTKTYIIDASFILAFLLNEDETIDAVINSIIMEKSKLFAPELLWYEVGNGLISAVLKKRINWKQAQKLYQYFLQFHIEKQTIIYEDIIDLCKKSSLTYYDAAYYYLSQKHNFKILSIDKKLL